eukprot:s3166_g6.t1
MFEADKALLGRRSKLHSCARLTWNGRGGVRQAEVQQLMQLDSASTPASVLVELVKASHETLSMLLQRQDRLYCAIYQEVSEARSLVEQLVLLGGARQASQLWSKDRV